MTNQEKLDWIELWLAGAAVAVVLVGWISGFKGELAALAPPGGILPSFAL